MCEPVCVWNGGVILRGLGLPLVAERRERGCLGVMGLAVRGNYLMAVGKNGPFR